MKGLFALSLAALATLGAAQSFRPSAVPLVTSDPYLSIWSEADRLTDDVTRHWTHAPHPLTSLIRVDGEVGRIMGKASPEALEQRGLEVTATRTTYTFASSKVEVKLEFLTPALPQKLDLYSRPVTYVTWHVHSVDGRNHNVQLFLSMGSSVAVNSDDQPVTWNRNETKGLTVLSAGTQAQTLLRPMGDDVRIDWGYAYLSAPASQTTSAIGSLGALADQFAASGKLDGTVDGNGPRTPGKQEPTLALSFDLGSVDSGTAARQAMISYDEIYAIDYYGQKLRPYWNRNGVGMVNLLRTALLQYPIVSRIAAGFDKELYSDAEKVGGSKYAQLVALSYRECVAACGLAADSQGKPLLFTKENTSNGDIATVDVIFPMDPIWVLLSPNLAKASLESNFAYAASPHWKFPNAPHDLGTYPRVFGRDDGGEGMPVEESGNMIILTDAIAHAEGNAKYAKRWWPQLTQWANYLEKYGLDPEDQLCTDDFMGHLAHNANLSIKAILALAAYGDLADMLGKADVALRYKDLAHQFADHFMKVADAGDHSLLAFDKPATWSQKYNLVWDKLLGLKVFPDEIATKEIAFYKKSLLTYGLPLDSRTHLTKSDWTIWSATMATNLDDFKALTDPLYDYVNQTTTRDPIADSYETDKIESGGMHARPVVGGFFIKLLSDPEIWKKWATAGGKEGSIDTWAPLPKMPEYVEVVPTARTKKLDWAYTIVKPSGDWTSAGFDDSAWKVGRAGFGTEGTPDAVIGTVWSTDDIWLRRSLTVPKFKGDLKLVVYHDEDVEVYINGKLAFSEGGYDNSYQIVDISAEALKELKPRAKVTVAVHCHQTTGGQGVDIGFAVAKP